MRVSFRGVRVVGSSFLIGSLLLACGGGETDSGTSETQNNNGGTSGGGTSSAGGSGQTAGTSAGAGKAGSSTGGTSAGKAGDAGSGQAGTGGSGQAGEAGTGQAGDAGSGQAGDAGSGQAGEGGSGQAGDGGSGQGGGASGGGQAGVGGSAQGGSGQAGSGVSGQAGAGGSGQAGTGGSGGSPSGCCKVDADCAGPDPVVQVCVGGQCKLPPSKGLCWEDTDCGVGFTCEGEFICPCGALCGPVADSEGKCVPVGSDCCQIDDECKKQGLDQCVEGVCRAKLAAGTCWDTADCSPGEVCQNAAPCPCGFDCNQDSPGKCVGASGNCCKQDADCGLGGACVNSVCKAAPPPGQCWEDADCGAGATCQGGFVCPCGAACILPDSLGKCTPGGGDLCCKEDADCAAQGLDKCALDICVKKAPSGQCWEDIDCKPGQTCTNEQICPCNADCIPLNTPGKCTDTAPPGCCKQDADCGDKNQCVLGGSGALQGVCKPLLIDGSCWDDGDCKPGQLCTGEQVCPCGAACLLPDAPGKCK